MFYLNCSLHCKSIGPGADKHLGLLQSILSRDWMPIVTLANKDKHQMSVDVICEKIYYISQHHLQSKTTKSPGVLVLLSKQIIQTASTRSTEYVSLSNWEIRKGEYWPICFHVRRAELQQSAHTHLHMAGQHNHSKHAPYYCLQEHVIPTQMSIPRHLHPISYQFQSNHPSTQLLLYTLYSTSSLPFTALVIYLWRSNFG